MATIRHAVRRALRDSTLGRYDRTYRRPHRRQACYGEFIMPSFHQPRPRPGFLIDTSSSMEDSQLARAVAELGGLTRQLGYGADVVVACCDAAVHDVRKVFSATQVELYGGGGTDMGCRAARVHREEARSDRPAGHRQRLPARRGRTRSPPFPVITIRVGDGTPPPWGHQGANRVITIEEPRAASNVTRLGGDSDGGLQVARDESLEAASADDSAGLVARLGQARRVGILDGHARLRRAERSAAQLIVTAPDSIVTVFDLTNCYAAPPVDPAVRTRRLPSRRPERGVQPVVRAAADRRRGMAPVGVVERGRAEADHRRLPEAARRLVRARLAQPAAPGHGRGWCGPTASRWSASRSALVIGLLVSAVLSSAMPAKPPIVRVETSQSFRVNP